MQLTPIRRWWLALLVALLLVCSPAAALASEVDTDTDTGAASGSQSQPIFDDLDYTKLYLRNSALYQLDDEIIRAGTSPEKLMLELQKLDPYARYYNAKAYEAMLSEGEGDVIGIGVFLATDENGQVFILGAVAGGSAEKAGLQYGDIIVSVDGKDTRNMTAQQLVEQIQGDDGDLLVIRYERDGVVYENTLSRNSRPEPSLSYWLLDDQEGIAYLHIEQFTSHTGTQMENALKSLQKQGMTGLILDLRGCPGGLVDSAIEVSAQFAGPGPMVFFINRRGWDQFYGLNEAEVFKMPMAVLIDGYTASSAELLAANIQDAGAAPLIGETSYGKGVVQSIISLPSGAGIVFTTAKYISHGYQDITANGGILPDLYVKGKDAQLEAAIASVEAQRQVPSQLTFYVGGTGEQSALLLGGSSYVPAQTALAQLGWELSELDGMIYGQRQDRRLIIDTAAAQILTGHEPVTLQRQEGTLYLPAALLRDLGHSVEWNAAERSVTVMR